jgi:hypothetical protein
MKHLQLSEPDPGVHRLLQAREISRVLSQCDPVANGVDTALLEHVSPIEWDNVVLYGQYIGFYVSEGHHPTSSL